MKKRLPNRFLNYSEWESKAEFNKYFNFVLPFNLKTNEFKKLLTQDFSPIVRKFGFKGSGFRYIKTYDNGYIHVIEILAAKQLGGCQVFSGIHLDFLPASIFIKKDLKKIKAHECFIQKIITLPNNNSIFDYGNNIEEAHETISYILEAIKQQAFPFFKIFEKFPEPFSCISSQDVIKKSIPFLETGAEGVWFELSIARIFCKMDEKEKAKEIVDKVLKTGTLKDNFIFEPLFKRILVDDLNFFYDDSEIKKISLMIEKDIANTD